ncbi:hypothetical protein ONZ45_g7416 [Pleurotus djamor]|nr:hypothetical protein ONZ45_g7416 [Pleurotus djamor]
MGQFFEEIPERLMPWVMKQHMFWVATAPLKEDGHVNVSPKGFEDSFHIVNSRKVWYEDLTGSGSETIAHLKENGRITVLFHAFEGPPRICRIFGTGTVYEFGSPEYNELLPPSSPNRKPGSRAIIMIDVYKVGTSCGYAVPFYEFKRHRTQLLEMSTRFQNLDRDAELALEDPSTEPSPPRPNKSLKWYWSTHNMQSLDGLPSIETAHESFRLFEPVTKVFKKDDISEKGAGNAVQDALRLPLVEGKVVVAFALGMIAATSYMKFLPYISSSLIRS